MTTSGRGDLDPLDRALREIRGPVAAALGAMPNPIWIADRLGSVRWMNDAARSTFGSRVGADVSRFVAADSVAGAREKFARKVHGRLHASVQELTMNAVAGEVRAEMTSVPIHDGGRVIGVISWCRTSPGEDARDRVAKPRLTPRQHQVLRLLADGRSTIEISEILRVTEDTTRNHIRLLLKNLRVRTRVEAVVIALRNGWV
jgi:DNA-binding CsgD family transcriptional regulator